jgi:hypothetical protein
VNIPHSSLLAKNKINKITQIFGFDVDLKADLSILETNSVRMASLVVMLGKVIFINY